MCSLFVQMKGINNIIIEFIRDSKSFYVFHMSAHWISNFSVILVRKIILVSVHFFINHFSFSSILVLHFKIFSF